MARKGASQLLKHFEGIKDAHIDAIDGVVKTPLIVIKPQKAIRLIRISKNVVRRDRRVNKN